MAAHAAIGTTEPHMTPVAEGSGVRGPCGWQELLERSADGQNFGDGDTQRRVALSGDVMADLSHFGLIAVDGPEAGKFLGSLLTGDIRLVSPRQGQFTGWCDGKGRLLATFWLFMRGDTYYLLLPIELLPSILGRLRQFLLRTKASVSDASASLARVGFSGPGIAAHLGSAVGGDGSVTIGATVDSGDCTVVAIGTAPQPRWLAIGPVEALGALWTQLLPAVRPVGCSTWSLLDIVAGIPLLVPETSGEFIPQMLNLEALGGLSFTKGCYPGQEVVARLQYRGQLKRRLYFATVAGDEVPAPGAKLYGPGTSESVGRVIAAAAVRDGEAALLTVMLTEQQEQGDISLHDRLGPRLAVAAAGAVITLNL